MLTCKLAVLGNGDRRITGAYKLPDLLQVQLEILVSQGNEVGCAHTPHTHTHTQAHTLKSE